MTRLSNIPRIPKSSAALSEESAGRGSSSPFLGPRSNSTDIAMHFSTLSDGPMDPEVAGWLDERIESDLSAFRTWLDRAAFAFLAFLVVLLFGMLTYHFNTVSSFTVHPDPVAEAKEFGS